MGLLQKSDPAGTDFFAWDNRFETGIPEIDRQHRRLLQLVNELGRILAVGTEADSSLRPLFEILDELVDYAKYHFDFEESLMGRFDYGAEEERAHRQAHADFTERMKAARGAADVRPDEVAGRMLTFLLKWLMTHIVGTDMLMAKKMLASAPDEAPETADSVLLHAMNRLYDGLAGRTQDLLLAKRGLDREIRVRKQTEAELHKLSRAVEQSPVSIFITDAQGNFEYVNPKFTALTGYALEELRGKTPRILKSGKTSPEQYEALWNTIGAGKEWKGELSNRKKCGELYWNSAAISPVFDSEGKITHYVSVQENISERRALEQELVRQARTDALTGLFNRRHLIELAEQELARARRYEKPLSVLMFDLDEFKAINDTHGHHAGDEVLRKVGEVCPQMLRGVDIMGRMGGEEFAVLLPETDEAHAAEVAERLRLGIAAVSIPLAGGQEVRFTASIGVATLDPEEADIDRLLNQADQAMYEAKRAGRNRVCAAPS